MEKVKEFYIEKSKTNKQQTILIAITESGQKYVCSGDHWSPTYLIPYERAFDTKE